MAVTCPNCGEKENLTINRELIANFAFCLRLYSYRIVCRKCGYIFRGLGNATTFKVKTSEGEITYRLEEDAPFV